VQYDTSEICSKIRVDQDPVTGEVEMAGDYRHKPLKVQSADGSSYEYEELIPFTQYYAYYQSSPIAAYLIPKDMADGTEVMVADPIEDHVGQSWNQGQTYRATFVPGFVEGRRVRLKPEQIGVCNFVG
jgi:hypothetical protein